MEDLQKIFTNYYTCIDVKSKEIADLASKNQDISEITLKFINEIYQSVNSDSNFHSDHFYSAYHLAITPLVEFFIARIFYYYSECKELNWNVNLRCQENKTVPDIRIFFNGTSKQKTIAIIEIKTTVSWMQACFAEAKAIAEEKRRQEERSTKDAIVDFNNQIQKYLDAYKITKEQFFVFIPSLNGVYKLKYKKDIEYYKKWFYSKANLKEENLILLSNNPKLNLEEKNIEDIQATHNFEFLLKSLGQHRFEF